MKKIIACLLFIIFTVSFIGCSKADSKYIKPDVYEKMSEEEQKDIDRSMKAIVDLVGEIKKSTPVGYEEVTSVFYDHYDMHEPIPFSQVVEAYSSKEYYEIKQSIEYMYLYLNIACLGGDTTKQEFDTMYNMGRRLVALNCKDNKGMLKTLELDDDWYDKTTELNRK